MSGRVRALLLLLVGAAVLIAALQQPDGAEASGHTATRAFASPSVAPGGQIEVTITAQNYGAFARVMETLPLGFRYVGSSLPDSAVSVRLATITFTLLGEEQFTYTVQAPAIEASYSFSGLVRDQHGDERQIGGDTDLRVGPPPTPTPTPAPTAPAAPTATPVPATPATPTATPVPEATPIPAPAVTATPVPAATPRPTATPTPEPTAMPVPRPTAAPTPGPVPIVEVPEEGGVSPWLVLLPLLGLALLVGCWGVPAHVVSLEEFGALTQPGEGATMTINASSYGYQ